MVNERSAVPSSDRWNVEALFPNLDDWQEAFDKAFSGNKPRWPGLAEFKGRLGESPEVLAAALELYFAHDRLISALYTYAHLRHDEEITNEPAKIAYSRIYAIVHDFAEENAWIEPELLSLDGGTLEKLIQSPEVEPYQFHLQKIARLKAHTLPPDQERLLAQSSKALQACHKAFSALNDADFQFGSIKDGEGTEHELTHSLYGLYIREHDRDLRENAFKSYHQVYCNHENTLCELLNGQVQTHIFNARARRYGGALEAALQPKNIDLGVYHALIAAVNEKIGALHSYMEMRQRIMQVEQLHLYDVYVPLIKEVEIKIPYSEAEDLIIASVAPLGNGYQNALRKGLKEQRWVDKYENRHKRSGAYSSGSYDSYPYILMNYKEQLKDAMTLAHEAGHSMHSLYTNTHQPYHYGHYPIFLAEVASTFNEELLLQLLLKNATNNAERIYLINQKIEDLRATLFRQTMFAEFELLIHEMAEKDEPLTPEILKQRYHGLNGKYFGSQVVIDQEGEIEWARIPHFYYNFYVFQYATGVSAALALAERVCQGGREEQEAYLNFLKSGSSRYPIETLQLAGVDMCSAAPVKTAISKFTDLVNQLELLLELEPKPLIM